MLFSARSGCLAASSRGFGNKLKTCPIALSGLAALGFIVILGTLWISRHVESVKSAISETALASVTLYHVSSATHATVPSEGHGEQSGMGAMRMATKQLHRSMDKLLPHIDHDAGPHVAFWDAPLDTLAHEIGLVDPPQVMSEIWHGVDGEATISTILLQQFSTCEVICTSPNMSEDEKSARLKELNQTVVNNLLPRLQRLREEASAWQARLLGTTNIVILTAFACIVASILFTRFGVVGPLVRDLDAANSNLSAENDKLEQMVAVRTQGLKLALDQAQDAHETRTRFLGSVNHEMRTPLNGVLGVAALLRSTPLDERQTMFVDTIVKSGQILVRLIDDVLDYVSLNAGKMHLISQSVRVRDAVEESLTLLCPVAKEKGLSLKFHCGGGEAVPVYADPDRLQQIVNNVVGNAIKFTTKGGVRVMLEQRVTGDTVQVFLRIEDSGAGIEQDKLERMFEPFDRAALGVPTPGAGLGLAVTKALIEEMSGTISVESEMGHGSLFTIRLALPIATALGVPAPKAA